MFGLIDAGPIKFQPTGLRGVTGMAHRLPFQGKNCHRQYSPVFSNDFGSDILLAQEFKELCLRVRGAGLSGRVL